MLLLRLDEAIISFTRINQPNGWLGNMSRHAISDGDPIVGDIRWRTAEAMFQARRFERGSYQFYDILDAASPMTAKMIAKREWKHMIIAPRSAEDLASMEVVLRAKLRDHPSLRVALNETGEAHIVEDVSARPSPSGLFWGMNCTPRGWVGDNHLGLLWMKLRGERG